MQINHIDGSVLYEDEADTLKRLVERAVEAGAHLSGADLCGADLTDAYLSGAYLCGADLSGAYLCGADLHAAYLSGAYLCGADLRTADLRTADLAGAVLCGVQFDGAMVNDRNRVDYLARLTADEWELVRRHRQGATSSKPATAGATEGRRMWIANAIVLTLLLVGQVRVTDCYPKCGVVIEPNGQGVTCYTRIENDDGSDICQYECVVNVHVVTFDADHDGDVDLADFQEMTRQWTGPR